MILALDDFDAFRTSEFQTSLIVGACALLVGALSISRRRSATAARLLGAVVVLAWLVSVVLTREPPAQLSLGLVLLFAAGLLHDVAKLPFPVAVAFGSVGAWVTSTGGDFYEVSDVVVLVLIVAAAAAFTGFATCEHEAMVAVPVLLVTTGGLYATLPDTEWVVVAIGALVPLLLLSQPGMSLRLGAAGSFLAAGLFASTIAVSWGGRESAVVGAYGSLGLFVVVPLAMFTSDRARDFWHEHGRVGPVPWLVAVLATHVTLVLICARVAGLRGSAAVAVAIAAVTLAAGWLALVAAAHRFDLADERSYDEQKG